MFVGVCVCVGRKEKYARAGMLLFAWETRPYEIDGFVRERAHCWVCRRNVQKLL